MFKRLDIAGNKRKDRLYIKVIIELKNIPTGDVYYTNGVICIDKSKYDEYIHSDTRIEQTLNQINCDISKRLKLPNDLLMKIEIDIKTTYDNIDSGLGIYYIFDYNYITGILESYRVNEAHITIEENTHPHRLYISKMLAYSSTIYEPMWFLYNNIDEVHIFDNISELSRIRNEDNSIIIIPSIRQWWAISRNIDKIGNGDVYIYDAPFKSMDLLKIKSTDEMVLYPKYIKKITNN